MQKSVERMLTKLDAGVFLADFVAVVVCKEHVCRETSLGGRRIFRDTLVG
jgi:hypothetical protein